MLLGKVSDCGSPYMDPGSLRTAVSLYPQGGPERTCKEVIHWSSRLKLQSKECSRKRWSMEERKLQWQPEKKLGQTKNNIYFFTFSISLSAENVGGKAVSCRSSWNICSWKVSPTHRMSSPKWVIEVSSPIQYLVLILKVSKNNNRTFI